MDTEMLIGDRMEQGTETAEPILNPRTGAPILDLHEASPAQVDAAVAAAPRGLRGGRAPPPPSAPPRFCASPTASRPTPRASPRSRR